MKVFISSVRRGLETERDSLPGLIRALGHEVLRFEDFSAQPVPSREACLRGVEAADAYLLLLGPFYGDPLPETGKSPTHEEYTVALTKGIPRLAFRKTDVDLEPAQAEFVAEIEAYSTGLFRASFANAVDLQAEVASALRNLPQSVGSIVWSPLPQPAPIEWRDSWSAPPLRPLSLASEVEVHALPLSGSPLSARQLRETADDLAGRLRALGIVNPSAGIDLGSDADGAWAASVDADPRGGWDDVRREATLGVRISRLGQRSVWQRLPADRMGSLLDPDDLPARLGVLLRVLGNLTPPNDVPWALAVGIRPATTLAVGPIGSLGRRSSAQMNVSGRGDPRVEPDEAVSVGALAEGADEACRVLAQGLLDVFARRR